MDGGESDATTDAITDDAGPSCGVGSLAPCAAVTWNLSADLPVPNEHHTTFIRESDAGVYLYSVGGFNEMDDTAIGNIYDQIYRAKVQSDGALGTWETLTSMPEHRNFHTHAEANGRAYEIGGIRAFDAAAGSISYDYSVLVIDFDEGGYVSSMRGATSLPAPAAHSTAAVIGSKLYVVGGLTGDTSNPQYATAKSYAATIQSNGLLSAWTEQLALPVARSHHGLIAHNGHLFVVGGQNSMSTLSAPAVLDILRSEHDANGNITAWTKIGALDTAPLTTGLVEYEGYLYMVGGIYGNGFSSRVRRAEFLADNTLGPVEEVTSLPIARSHVHQVPLYNGHIYSVAGRGLIDGGFDYHAIPTVVTGTFAHGATPVPQGVAIAAPTINVDLSTLASDLDAAHSRLLHTYCACEWSALGYASESDCEWNNNSTGESHVAPSCGQMAYAAVSAPTDALRCVAQGVAFENACADALGASCDVSNIVLCFGYRDRSCPAEDPSVSMTIATTVNACVASTFVGTGADTCTTDEVASSTIGAAALTGTTALAGDHRHGSCGGTGAADVAIRWTAPSAGTYTFDPGASSFDTVIYLLPDDCTSPELGCADNSPDSATAFLTRVPVTATLTSGQTIRIIVDGAAAFDAGAYSIAITKM